MCSKKLSHRAVLQNNSNFLEAFFEVFEWSRKGQVYGKKTFFGVKSEPDQIHISKKALKKLLFCYYSIVLITTVSIKYWNSRPTIPPFKRSVSLQIIMLRALISRSSRSSEAKTKLASLSINSRHCFSSWSQQLILLPVLEEDTTIPASNSLWSSSKLE